MLQADKGPALTARRRQSRTATGESLAVRSAASRCLLRSGSIRPLEMWITHIPPFGASSTTVNGQLVLNVGGQQNCALVAKCFARWWPTEPRGGWGSVQGRDSFAGGGLGEADAVAGGEYEVGVVHEPVDGGVGDGLGHELVEPGGVQVAR